MNIMTLKVSRQNLWIQPAGSPMLACPGCRECSLLTPWGGVMWVGASSRELSCIPAAYKLLTEAKKINNRIQDWYWSIHSVWITTSGISGSFSSPDSWRWPLILQGRKKERLMQKQIWLLSNQHPTRHLLPTGATDTCEEPRTMQEPKMRVSTNTEGMLRLF